MCEVLSREGVVDDYYIEIPFEFHGQKVLAYNLNPERANLEVLNDGSDLVIYGLKTEGPGTAVKTINKGVTYVFNNSSASGNPLSQYPLYSDDADSNTIVIGGSAFGVRAEPELEYRCIYAKEGEPDFIRGKENPFLFDINKD